MASENGNVIRWNCTADGKLIDNRREFLKVVALVTMLIDHIGMIFFPDVLALRIIGRIAFPIYAYLVATGLDWTGNKFLYFLRLAIIAVLAQYGFSLFVPGCFNIVFTFALFVPAYWLWRSGHKAVALLLALASCLVEYNLYGLLLVAVLRLADRHKVRAMLLCLLLTALYCVLANNPVQAFSLLALPVIFRGPCLNYQIPNWLWRWFYPVHFLILMGVKLLCVH